MDISIYIDADGCPVVDETVALCAKYNIDCTIICDTSHSIKRIGAKTVVVEKGADSADFKLVNMLKSGDICVTQDYGLAAMCLAKNARVLNQDGVWYTQQNIDALLYSRYYAKKVRMAGGRLKGPHKREAVQTKNFNAALEKVLSEITLQ